MPQMSPMMWFSLFILFSFTMITFNQLMFFSFKTNKMISLNEKMLNNNSMTHWKW
uniref:ATP synthase complex subunit 8 n=1 Tax=Tagasta indica TaxID=281095 RepID=A0A6C0PT79_9ORTH|nr:ATP synthase F0 subunit 8 [Tagasta indica]YP_010892330.1 ATP synthase F0 subunit 8 [Tagasta tonkinensis]QHX99914.1 ATP synthase F0 subunit 8 [Tagasta indica]WJO90063.1 ATP synthase F0 subunit 8 [Tagasta tonkinensis]